MAQTNHESATPAKKTPPLAAALAPGATPGRKKVSVKNVKLSDQEVGYTFRGIYRGTAEGQTFQQLDQRTGELVEKRLSSLIMEDQHGNRTAYLADKGLLGAFTDALVKEGQLVEVVKLAKVAIGKGRTMNSYDIFQLESWDA